MEGPQRWSRWWWLDWGHVSLVGLEDRLLGSRWCRVHAGHEGPDFMVGLYVGRVNRVVVAGQASDVGRHGDCPVGKLIKGGSRRLGPHCR